MIIEKKYKEHIEEMRDQNSNNFQKKLAEILEREAIEKELLENKLKHQE
jgi:hypothetical protein